MALHRTLTASDGIHILQSYEYADETARLAATGFTSADVGKVCCQIDNVSFWILTNDDPVTWQALGGSFLNNPMTTWGDIIFGGSGAVPTRLEGVEGAYLRSHGVDQNPTFTRDIDADTVLVTATVGASPDTSAALQVDSITKGFLLPRMTAAQRDAIATPTAGLSVYVPLTRRIWWFDGDGWRRLSAPIGNTLTVAVDGSAEFTSIQDAIDSITTATDLNRWTVEVAPGVYAEDIQMADYIQVHGFGWDTLIEGQIICNSLDYTQIAGCRVASVNKPCLTVNMNADGEVNITDCFMFADWDDSEDPSVIRRSVDCVQGVLYVYKESEFTLSVTDTTNVAGATRQTVFRLYGSDACYIENYGTYCYIETDNPGNTLSLVYTTNTNADTDIVFSLGQFEIAGIGTHYNTAKVLEMFEAAGHITASNFRCVLNLPGGSPVLIFTDVRDSTSDQGTADCANCQVVPEGAFADANVYIGRATTANDHVHANATLFALTADVQPGRETTGGDSGEFLYSVVNNFGSQWSSGLFNEAEVGADVTDWGNVEAALGGEAGAVPNLVFKSDGAGGGAMVPNLLKVARRLTVSSAGDADHTSILAAITAAIAGGASATTPWAIIVYPGTYTEDPMTLPAGICLTTEQMDRMDTVFIVANNAAADLFTCAGGYMAGFRLSGVTDSSYALIRCGTPYTNTLFHGVSLRGCSNGAIIQGGAAAIFLNVSIQITGAAQSVTTGLTVTGASSYLAISNGFFSCPSVLLPYYAANPIQTCLKAADGAYCYLDAGVCRIAHKDDTADIVRVTGGATVIIMSSEMTGCANGIHIDSGGTGSKVVAASTTFTGNVLNVYIESSTASCFVNTSTDVDAKSIAAGAVYSGTIIYRDANVTKMVGPVNYQYRSGKEVELSEWFAEWGSTGLAYGGAVTAATGLHVDVAGGEGWCWRRTPTHDIEFVEWEAVTDLDLTASQTNYIYFDPAVPEIVAGTSSPGESCVLLATVVCDGSGIRFLHQTRCVMYAPQRSLHDYLLLTRKIAISSGLGTIQGTGVRNLDVGSGAYYRALDLISYAGSGGDATWSYFYGTNGATEVASVTVLNITQYDNAGTLTAMTSGYFRSDTLILTSDGRLSVIYGTEQFATQPLAEAAALGNTPTFMEETACTLAQVVVEEGVGIATIIDRRPMPASSGGGGAGGVSVHSALAGLSADDHTQYLLANGTRSMSGSLNMGGQQITNVGNVDGVDVSAHASRHLPGGTDALAVATPVGVTVGATAAEGDAASFARSNHQHGITRGTPATVGTANDAGTASTVAGSDHVHSHGDHLGGSLHANAVASTSAGFLSGADKAKLDGVATGATNTPITNTAPVNVTKATAAVGTSGEAARQDHKHDVTTAIAGAATPGATAAEGTATSLARSDHAHSLPAYGTTAGTFCQGDDSRLSDNRTDANAIHKNVANEISTITEKVTPASADLIIIEDSAASGAKKKVQVGNLSGPVFGTQAADWYLGTSTTTNSTSWQTRQTQTTASLPAGRYRVGWSYNWRTNRASNSFEGQVLIDGAPISAHVQEPKDTASDQSHWATGFTYVNLTAATHTIEIQYRSSSTAATSQIWTSRLEIWRIS